MADSVEDALNEAIAELESKELVKEVHVLKQSDNPGNWIEFLLAVLHKVKGQEGYAWSHKKVYVKDESPYEYLHHYGGPKTEEANTATMDFFLSKLDAIKQAKGFEFIEIEKVNETSESVVIYAIKENQNDEAIIFRVKCWKTGEGTFDYLIISKEVIA